MSVHRISDCCHEVEQQDDQIHQRQAYTCCAADLQPMGLLCFYECKSNFPNGQWIKATGTVRYFEDDDGEGGKINVPSIQVETYALTSKPENEVIYFN